MSETSLRLTQTIYTKVIDEVINQLRTDKSFERSIPREAIDFLEKNWRKKLEETHVWAPDTDLLLGAAKRKQFKQPMQPQTHDESSMMQNNIRALENLPVPMEKQLTPQMVKKEHGAMPNLKTEYIDNFVVPSQIGTMVKRSAIPESNLNHKLPDKVGNGTEPTSQNPQPNGLTAGKSLQETLQISKKPSMAEEEDLSKHFEDSRLHKEPSTSYTDRRGPEEISRSQSEYFSLEPPKKARSELKKNTVVDLAGLFEEDAQNDEIETKNPEDLRALEEKKREQEIMESIRIKKQQEEEEKKNLELQQDDPDELLNSDDDVVEEVLPDPKEFLLAFFEKSSRTGTKWKVNLKNGVILINGKEYILNPIAGEFEFK